MDPQGLLAGDLSLYYELGRKGLSSATPGSGASTHPLPEPSWRASSWPPLGCHGHLDSINPMLLAICEPRALLPLPDCRAGLAADRLTPCFPSAGERPGLRWHRRDLRVSPAAAAAAAAAPAVTPEAAGTLLTRGDMGSPLGHSVAAGVSFSTLPALEMEQCSSGHGGSSGRRERCDHRQSQHSTATTEPLGTRGSQGRRRARGHHLPVPHGF